MSEMSVMGFQNGPKWSGENHNNNYHNGYDNINNNYYYCDRGQRNIHQNLNMFTDAKFHIFGQDACMHFTKKID